MNGLLLSAVVAGAAVVFGVGCYLLAGGDPGRETALQARDGRAAGFRWFDLLGAYVAPLLLAAAVGASLKVAVPLSPVVRDTVTLGAGEAAILVAGLLLVRWRTGESALWRYFDAKQPVRVGNAFLSGIEIWIAAAFCGSLLLRLGISSGAEGRQLSGLWSSSGPDLRVVLLLIICFIGPLGEEIFFRGILVEVLAPRLPPSWTLIAAGVAFGLGHLTLLALLPLSVAGILLVRMYLRNRTLWPCVIAHGTFNLATLLIIALTVRG